MEDVQKEFRKYSLLLLFLSAILFSSTLFQVLSTFERNRETRQLNQLYRKLIEQREQLNKEYEIINLEFSQFIGRVQDQIRDRLHLPE